jgi:hypothetical protein
MFKCRLFLIAFAICILPDIFSQSDSVFMLPQLKIYQKENGKKVVYSFEQFKFNKFTVSGNYLIAVTHRYNYKVNINDIRQVSLRDGNNGLTLAGYGAALGFVLGFFAGGYFTIDGPVKFNIKNAIPAGFIIALPFGLIGGLVGMLSPDYDDYDLSKVTKDYRLEMLKKILKKNKVNY